MNQNDGMNKSMHTHRPYRASSRGLRLIHAQDYITTCNNTLSQHHVSSQFCACTHMHLTTVHVSHYSYYNGWSCFLVAYFAAVLDFLVALLGAYWSLRTTGFGLVPEILFHVMMNMTCPKLTQSGDVISLSYRARNHSSSN